MKKIFQNFFSQQFFTGSLIMFGGATMVNFGNYLFHLIVARMLGPAGYGVLQGIISSLYIIGIIPLSVGVIVVKYVSTLKGKGNEEGLSSFYYWSRDRLLVFGIILGIILILIIPYWSSFLNLKDARPLFFAIISFPLALILIHIRSFFSGVLNFFAYNLNTIIEVVLKIIFSVIFIYLGWQVLGVAIAMLMASLCSYLFSDSTLSLGKPSKIEFKEKKQLLFYYLPSLIVTFSLTSLFSNDIILVKHYFSDTVTGIYAAVSVLGKIIFYASSSLIAVMFPMISQKHAKGENFRQTFWLTVFVVILISLSINIIYFLFPELMLQLLFGNKFLLGKEILFSFGIFISLYSLSNVFINYFLSISKTKMAVFPLFFAILQIVLIVLWHGELKIVIYDSIVATFLLLISLLIYYKYESRR